MFLKYAGKRKRTVEKDDIAQLLKAQEIPLVANGAGCCYRGLLVSLQGMTKKGTLALTQKNKTFRRERLRDGLEFEWTEEQKVRFVQLP